MGVRADSFAQALSGFIYLTEVDMTPLADTLDERLVDAIENGKAQKFEYTLEWCWKSAKEYLKEQEGIDEASPKKVIKAFYLGGRLTEEDYLALLDAVDDSNKLSHVYDPAEFRAILDRLSGSPAMRTSCAASGMRSHHESRRNRDKARSGPSACYHGSQTAHSPVPKFHARVVPSRKGPRTSPSPARGGPPELLPPFQGEGHPNFSLPFKGRAGEGMGFLQLQPASPRHTTVTG